MNQEKYGQDRMIGDRSTLFNTYDDEDFNWLFESDPGINVIVKDRGWVLYEEQQGDDCTLLMILYPGIFPMPLKNTGNNSKYSWHTEEYTWKGRIKDVLSRPDCPNKIMDAIVLYTL